MILQIKDKINFLVLSDGCCGSAWLAANLDRHPLVACTCGFGVGLEVDHIDGGIWIDRKIRGDRMTQKYQANSVTDHFELIEKKYPSALVLGDVHGFTVYQYLRNLQLKGVHDSTRLAHLIRHPITYFERSLQHYIWAFEEYGEEFSKPILNKAKSLHHAIKLDRFFEFDPSDLRMVCFLSCLQDFPNHAENIWLARNIKTIYFEKMLSDPDYYADVVRHLTGGQVEVHSDYLEEVFSSESVQNTGRIMKTTCTYKSDPMLQFNEWSNLEQMLFTVVTSSLNLIEKFSHCDYDLSHWKSRQSTLANVASDHGRSPSVLLSKSM